MVFSLLKSLIPQRCLLCTALTSNPYPLCLFCHTDLPYLRKACRQCARPLPQDAIHCGECLKTKPPFEASFALFLYQPPIDHLLIALKFHNQLLYANLFGQLLTIAIKQWYKHHALPDVILPVPLHHKRSRERGFNQAIEIARPISRELNIALDINSVRRAKATLPQTSLSPKARRLNMQEAFQSDRYYHNLTIAIVDDVVTTGQTVKQLSQLLKKKGAKAIHILSPARTGN